MVHPWKKIIEEIRNRNWTQKQFAILVWKKNSEVNELIKWKRNITIQRDYILSQVLWTPEKYWINMQTDYDYEQMKQKIKEEKNNIQKFEVVEEVPEDNIQEIVNEDTKKENIVELWKTSDEKTKVDRIEQPQNNADENLQENNSTETIVEKKSSDDVSEEEKQQKKEVKKIFINF